MDELLYGVAYYDEYMPYDRLEKDVAMMKKAGINLVRIAESTWSTLEPQDGVFDFYHIDRVLDAMEEAGIHVIVGTPTYAIPAWMEKKHPDVMAVTKQGRGIYGARQIMDITNRHYLFYSERVIRKLMDHVKDRACVIGYQIDNETKYYGTAGEGVQEAFIAYLKDKFQGDVEAMNREFGMNYWSNALHSWEDFPDVRGTINGSLGCEFEKFQRGLVTEFLSWQAALVREYKREDQFITHNFDFEWRNHSFGVQPEVNHFHVSKCLDVAGCDIYHPTQSKLTGKEIAFGGDLTRSLKQDNYYVLETEAQGFTQWVPYDGQLRLQAFSHLAGGADCVEYWHWHSIHNSFETYWRGLLSHDFAENKTYREAVVIGNEMKRLGSHLLHLKKENKAAIMVSNEALSGLKWFPIQDSPEQEKSYNDVVRWIYDALYEMNVECDLVSPEAKNLEDYKMLILPALYCVPEETLLRIRRFTENGGCLLGTFKTAYANENVKVYHDSQPHILSECFGILYNQFTYPEDTYLEGRLCSREEKEGAEVFMECIQAKGAETVLRYVHDNWGQYAAVTENTFGKGKAVYLGCMFSPELLKKLLGELLKDCQIHPNPGSCGFPVIVRGGRNQMGKQVYYFLNYSGEKQEAVCPEGTWTELFSGETKRAGEKLFLQKWNLLILEEQ